jgi:hypothetical protein
MVLRWKKRDATMSLPQPTTRFLVEEYLARERQAEERHEYLDGEVYATAGESPEHGAICMKARI